MDEFPMTQESHEIPMVMSFLVMIFVGFGHLRFCS
jgi:hypothetical protein